MRVFTVLYILVGASYVFAQLASLLEGVLDAFISGVRLLQPPGLSKVTFPSAGLLYR